PSYRPRTRLTVAEAQATSGSGGERRGSWAGHVRARAPRRAPAGPPPRRVPLGPCAGEPGAGTIPGGGGWAHALPIYEERALIRQLLFGHLGHVSKAGG